MRRRIVPAELRNLSLEADTSVVPTPAWAFAAGAAALSGFGGLVLHPLLFGAAPVVATIAFFLARPTLAQRTVLPANMQVRPWGIQTAVAHPWGAIEELEHHRVMRGSRKEAQPS